MMRLYFVLFFFFFFLVTAKKGLDQIQSFMKSIGRFGKGAYLCTLYGGGSEISQAFSR